MRARRNSRFAARELSASSLASRREAPRHDEISSRE